MGRIIKTVLIQKKRVQFLCKRGILYHSLIKEYILFPFCFYAALAAFAHPRYALRVHAGGFVHLPPCLKANWFEHRYFNTLIKEGKQIMMKRVASWLGGLLICCQSFALLAQPIMVEVNLAKIER